MELHDERAVSVNHSGADVLSTMIRRYRDWLVFVFAVYYVLYGDVKLEMLYVSRYSLSVISRAVWNSSSI